MELIGREAELDVVCARLAERRLVTVIGPGGIGKTALARAVVARVEGSFPLGSRIVDLTRVADPGAVGEAMAGQLGFPTFEALLASPKDQPVLLLVDNCEHVTDEAATAIVALQEACRAPTVLATSRSPLDLPGEAVVALGPLALPPRRMGAGPAGAGLPPAVDSAAGDGGGAVPAAVRLFCERARDAGAPFDPDPAAVAELCRRLDGVPLAIEIAAARTRALSVADILARLDAGGLDVLARPRFRGAPRHRSLRATIEWSYRLLDEDDRRLFERLAVFAGPFTAATAHAVAGAPGSPPMATVDGLDALVAASLVVAGGEARAGEEGVTRYHLLGTVRAYAEERLDERGDLAATRDRFADHVVARVGPLREREAAGGSRAVLRELLGRYDDMAAALRWCLAQDTAPDRSLLLLAVLGGVVHQAHTAEVAGLGERALARWPDRDAAGWVDAAATVATCRYLLGRPDEAGELASGAHDALDALNAADGSRFAPVTLRRVLGRVHRARGETEEAQRLFTEAADQARAAGLSGWAVEADVARALVLADTGPAGLGPALDLARRAGWEAAELGAEINEIWARVAEGYILLRTDPGAARSVACEALEAARAVDYPTGVSVGLRVVALAHLAAGDHEAAAPRVLDLLDELAFRGVLTEFRGVLDVAAVVLHRAGDPAWADIAATARRQPVVSLTAGVTHELFPLPAHEGRSLSIGAAVELCRDRLTGLPRAGTEVPAAAGVPARPEEAVFRRVGEFWEIRYAGRSAHLAGSKGMDDLARLLAQPEREVHCLDLMGAGVQSAATGEPIDEAARRRYERRIRELQADVDEAEADHDDARAARARAELDALVDHLTAALGLGGRARRTGSDAERARSAVTQRVRAAIRRIAAAHPPLGRHLESSIRSGTYCAYRPETPTTWLT